MADKQLDEMLALLRGMAGRYVLTSVGGGRAAPASELAALLGVGEPVEPVSAAMKVARQRAGRDGLVLVCGSLALVGAVLAEIATPTP
jgi:dihydrofolate synthase/folylpolyglutamate synthase